MFDLVRQAVAVLLTVAIWWITDVLMRGQIAAFPPMVQVMIMGVTVLLVLLVLLLGLAMPMLGWAQGSIPT